MGNDNGATQIKAIVRQPAYTMGLPSKARAMNTPTLPLVYACSGCSNLAQLANRLAVTLDRTGQAEMSCIAGVGGNVKPLVDKARSGRRIVAIDGCPLRCTQACLGQHGVKADVILVLTELGLRKRQGRDASSEDFELAHEVIQSRLKKLSPQDEPHRSDVLG